MGSRKDFFTRQRANQGRRVYIPGPDGKPTAEWLHLLHTDSDAFRQGVSATLQKMAKVAEIRDPDQRKAAQEDLQYEAIAELITGWSFDEECTREAKIELLREAPYLKDFIDRKTADGSLFFVNESGNSSSTPPPAPGSSDPKKTAEPSVSTSSA